MMTYPHWSMGLGLLSLLGACLTLPTGVALAEAAPQTIQIPSAPVAPPAVKATAQAPSETAPAPREARCVRVIDGDTLVLDGDERVRVLYINTPEKREEFGPEAGAFTREMVLFKNVTLAYTADSERDHYGRLLAEVYVDGKSLSEALLAEGLAHLFLIAPESPPANVEHLIAVQNQAREAKRNMWGTDRYTSTLHVTSFHANARGNDHENINGEYLRVANVSGAPLNVGGYTLTTAHGKILTLPDFTVPAGYSFQILSGEGVTNDDPAAGPLQIYWGSKRAIYLNDGDSATLRDPSGQPVDKVVHAPKRR